MSEGKVAKLWGGSVRVGSLARIEIRIHWSALVLAAVLTASVSMLFLPEVQPMWGAAMRWAIGGACALVFFASLLLHELSHAVVARRLGISVVGIALFLLGGVSLVESEPQRPRDEFLIAIAGPLCSVVLAVGFGALAYATFAPGWLTLQTIALYASGVNLMVAAFNLLPGFPLDGGRVLRAIVWARKKNFPQATRVASFAGRAMATGLVTAGGVVLITGAFQGAWLAVLGAFLWNAARA